MLQRLGIVLFWLGIVLGGLYVLQAVVVIAVGLPAAYVMAWRYFPLGVGLIAAGVSARYIFGWRAPRQDKGSD